VLEINYKGDVNMSLSYQQMLEKLNGVIGLIPTHFKDDETLDLGAMRETTEYACEQLKGHEGAIMIAGSTSEFYAMTDEETLQMIDTVVKTANGRVPVIAGTGRAATGLTIDISKRAEILGIDCAMISNPYYMQITEEGLYRHFSKVAEALDVGVMIYNNPSTSKMFTPPNVIARLSKIPNIIASKENATTIEKYYWMKTETDPSEFKVCCGIGHLNYMFEAPFGCPAMVTELLLLAPNLIFDFYDACKVQNFAEANKLMDQIIPYHKFIARCMTKRSVPSSNDPEIGGRATALYQSVIKRAMELRGLPGGVVREPLENITDAEVAELKEVLKECGL